MSGARSRMVALAVFAAVLIVPAAAGGPRTACTVTPDPVSISSGEQYTVFAAGGVPLEWYEVIVRQRGDGCTDECRDWLGQADDFGNVTASFAAYAFVVGDGFHGLLVGDAKVSVVRYRTGGGPGGGASTIATCAFTVVP